MILSRVTEHLKQQNWTAVVLDFLIVVVGVFIGTNVSNWNDARKSHLRTQVYSQRLMADLRVEYEYSMALRQYLADTMAAGHPAFAGLTRPRPVDDRTVLIDAFRATRFQWNERRRAAYEELVSSGSLDQIADTALRDIAVRDHGTSATVIEQTLADMRDSRYRALFHESVDPDVQVARRRECGDRHYITPGGVGGVFEIG